MRRHSDMAAQKETDENRPLLQDKPKVPEEKDARKEDTSTPGRRRELFPELREPAEDVDSVLERLAKEAAERWNFDFKNETPLEGDWIWTKVDGRETESTDRKDQPVVAESDEK